MLRNHLITEPIMHSHSIVLAKPQQAAAQGTRPAAALLVALILCLGFLATLAVNAGADMAVLETSQWLVGP